MMDGETIAMVIVILVLVVAGAARILHLLYHWDSFRPRYKASDVSTLLLVFSASAMRAAYLLFRSSSLDSWPYLQSASSAFFATACVVVTRKWTLLGVELDELQQGLQLDKRRYISTVCIFSFIIIWSFCIAVFVLISLDGVDNSIQVQVFFAFNLAISVIGVGLISQALAFVHKSLAMIAPTVGVSLELVQLQKRVQTRGIILASTCLASFVTRTVVFVIAWILWMSRHHESGILFLLGSFLADDLPSFVFICLTGPSATPKYGRSNVQLSMQLLPEQIN